MTAEGSMDTERLAARAHVPKDEIGRRSYISVVGIFLLGIVALASPLWLRGVSAALLGGVFLCSGILELADGADTRRRKHGLRIGLAGLLPALFSVFLIFQLGVPSSSIIFAVGLFLMANGIYRLVAGGVDRYPQWRWDVGYGVVAAVMGLLTVLFARRMSSEVLMLIVGVELLLRALVVGRRDVSLHELSLREARGTAAH